MHTVVPCEDCDEKKRQLGDLGFRVLGCTEIADRPGFCRVEFVAGGAQALAAPQPAGAPAAGLTPTQVATAQAIVNLFETGAVLGDYGNVTLIPGDTGHLTFGRSQTTLGSGNLGKLLQQYCANPGAVFGERLAPYLPRFAAIDLTLDEDTKLHNVLRATADDRIMRETQDRFFDTAYWQPAHKAAARLGIMAPLGVAVVYDSHVHGSWGAMRDRTTAAVGTPAAAGERAWIAEYVKQRRQWLAGSTRDDLRATVYRMDAFQRLIANDMWALPLPLVVRGREISTLTLAALPPNCYDGPAPGSRVIGLTTPLMRGLDVRRVQLALSDRDVDIRADGIYGQTSERLVKAFQGTQGMPPTGILDPATILSLVA
jgi:chitosanase